MKTQKNRIKLSNMLSDALYKLKEAKLRKMQSCFEEFGIRHSQIAKDSHLFSYAVAKSWFKSAEKIKTRFNRNINDISYLLQRLKELINAGEAKVPNVSDIFAELLQIEQEHGEYKYDPNEKTISITTEPIVLKSIEFGPFEIKLFIKDISMLCSDNCYKVIALKPNPAGSNEEVTHPHVSSERLCEGDGYVAIRNAIEQGRFCDFFTMVISILQTYNPDSPYISLDDWEGISCYDCGCGISGEDSYCCENCDNDFCSSCSTYCRICSSTVCLQCSYECPNCGKRVCKHCLAACTACEEEFCKNCVNDEGYCENCEEQRKEIENEEQVQDSEESTADTAV